jgi:hypothetical protein
MASDPRFQIRDVQIQIQIRGSVPLDYESGYYSFFHFMLVDRRIRSVQDPGGPKLTDPDPDMDPEYCSGLSENMWQN